jgi:hypothetical protein
MSYWPYVVITGNDKGEVADIGHGRDINAALSNIIKDDQILFQIPSSKFGLKQSKFRLIRLNSFMKKEIEEVLNNLKKYISENNLNDDLLLKSLHDDLWIVLNTEGTKLNQMFLTARSNSNGKQLSYNINKIPNINIGFHFNSMLLSREPVNKMNSTPKQLEIMRSCSQPIDDEY